MSSSESIIKSDDKNYIRGTFWHDSNNVPTIEDILYVKEHLNDDKKIDKYLYNTDIDVKTWKSIDHHDQLVREYTHLGNMVTTLIDSRIPYLNQKLIDIQTEVLNFNTLRKVVGTPDGKFHELEQVIADKSLSLGCELQKETLKVLSEIGIIKEKIDISKFLGDESLKPLFVENSKYFPSNWNNHLKDIKRVKKTKKKLFSGEDPSSYTAPYKGILLPHSGLFQISNGDDGVLYYPSMAKAEQSKVDNPLEYYSRHEIVHEMTHMFEKASPLIKSTTANFLKGRITAKGKVFPRHDLAGPDHMVYLDEFTNVLSGTVYGETLKRNEIMARGSESVLLGTNGSLVGLPRTASMRGGKVPNIVDNIPDIEYRNLTLGILVGVEMQEYF